MEYLSLSRDPSRGGGLNTQITLRLPTCPPSFPSSLPLCSRQSRMFEEALAVARIPFRVLGEKPFWTR